MFTGGTIWVLTHGQMMLSKVMSVDLPESRNEEFHKAGSFR